VGGEEDVLARSVAAVGERLLEPAQLDGIERGALALALVAAVVVLAQAGGREAREGTGISRVVQAGHRSLQQLGGLARLLVLLFPGAGREVQDGRIVASCVEDHFRPGPQVRRALGGEAEKAGRALAQERLDRGVPLGVAVAHLAIGLDDVSLEPRGLKGGVLFRELSRLIRGKGLASR
jgi:hypothetical protein